MMHMGAPFPMYAPQVPMAPPGMMLPQNVAYNATAPAPPKEVAPAVTKETPPTTNKRSKIRNMVMDGGVFIVTRHH
jgi:hypothetical protein